MSGRCRELTSHEGNTPAGEAPVWESISQTTDILFSNVGFSVLLSRDKTSAVFFIPAAAAAGVSETIVLLLVLYR